MMDWETFITITAVIIATVFSFWLYNAIGDDNAMADEEAHYDLRNRHKNKEQ